MLSTIKAICVLPRGPQLAAQCHTKPVTAGARDEEQDADGGPWAAARRSRREENGPGQRPDTGEAEPAVLREPGRPAEGFTPRRTTPLPSRARGEGSCADTGVEIQSAHVKTLMCFPETKRHLLRQPPTCLRVCLPCPGGRTAAGR